MSHVVPRVQPQDRQSHTRNRIRRRLGHREPGTEAFPPLGSPDSALDLAPVALLDSAAVALAASQITLSHHVPTAVPRTPGRQHALELIPSSQRCRQFPANLMNGLHRPTTSTFPAEPVVFMPEGWVLSSGKDDTRCAAVEVN